MSFVRGWATLAHLFDILFSWMSKIELILWEKYVDVIDVLWVIFFLEGWMEKSEKFCKQFLGTLAYWFIEGIVTC